MACKQSKETKIECEHWIPGAAERKNVLQLTATANNKNYKKRANIVIITIRRRSAR